MILAKNLLFLSSTFGWQAGGMDPQQRHVLETSYEALFNAGALLLCFNDVVCFCYEMYACLPAAYTYIINYYIIH